MPSLKHSGIAFVVVKFIYGAPDVSSWYLDKNFEIIFLCSIWSTSQVAQIKSHNTLEVICLGMAPCWDMGQNDEVKG